MQLDVLENLDVHEVMRRLPHRYPFLLIDRVLRCEPGKSLVGLKNVTYNEPFFTGHFPHRPVMPGVLILEAMAQATGILAFITTEQYPTEKALYFFVGADKTRFRQIVTPGDQLIIEVEFVKKLRGVWKFEGRARVDDQVVAVSDLMCAEREVQ